MSGNKDSAEVIKFMTLFARLKLWSDDAPEELADQAATDTSVSDLCAQLSLAGQFLKMNERRARQLFAAPVDPTFLAAWRDYEERYETVVSMIWLSVLLPDRSKELADTYPDVTQLIWADLLAFIWHRFHAYRNQKTQVEQWDTQGRKIKRIANESSEADAFVKKALRLMGVRNAD